MIVGERTKWVIREFLAAVVWSYIFLKLLVFDIDNFLLTRFTHFGWLLQFKAFIILGLTAILWLVLGKDRFPKAALYMTAYPAILLFWRLPKIVFRRWSLVIIAAPAIYRSATTIRTNFLIYTVAILSALATFVSTNRSILIIAVISLIVFVLVHLLRSLRVAYSEGPFIRLAGLLSRLRSQIDKGMFDGTQTAGANAAGPNPTLYLMRQLADWFDEKIIAAANSRRYDICLIVGLLYTVSLTCFTFALAYRGLQKIDPSSFSSTEGTSFWAFLNFSVGAVTPGQSFSGIAAVTIFARLVYRIETISFVLIFIILVFIILTAAREAFRHDVEVFSQESRLLAEAIDARISQVYKMTLEELEANLLSGTQKPLVNAMRKMRGRPELSAPPSEAGRPVDPQRPSSELTPTDH